MHLLITLLVFGQAAQALPAINAAKNASAQVTEAQKKNSEALEPRAAVPPAGAVSAPVTTSTGSVTAPATSAGQPPAAGSAPPAEAETSAPTAQGAYSYDPSGRRDPFVSLLLGGTSTRPTGATRPAGLPGLLIGEVSVKGVLTSKGNFVAILQAADSKTYLAHMGDKVMDGAVKSITQDAVVFSQEVNDPLSLVKQREVRKTIRPETR
jgi:type IV pilus assembly protein PilP